MRSIVRLRMLKTKKSTLLSLLVMMLLLCFSIPIVKCPLVTASFHSATESAATTSYGEPTSSPDRIQPNLAITSKGIFLGIGAGFAVEVQGSLTSNSIGLSGLPVWFSAGHGGEDPWIDPISLTTNENGSFYAYYMFTGDEICPIKTEFPGNDLYSEATVSVNVATMHVTSDPNMFTVAANSTLSALDYNYTSSELAFQVNGVPNTTGYTEVYVSKPLVHEVSSIKVNIDGNPVTYTSESADDSWLISFAYGHSNHSVTLTLANSSPTNENADQYPLWGTLDSAVVAALIITIVVVIVLLKITRNRNTGKSDPSFDARTELKGPTEGS
jgi:hypothetical protein